MFEGDYFNGKRWNGKGKEYNNNRELIFEGEYLNGKRLNGKGKEYKNDEGLIFEGEYLNGDRWNGQGKEVTFNKTEKIIFNIKYINGFKEDLDMSIYYDIYEKNILIYKGEHYKGKKMEKEKNIIY